MCSWGTRNASRVQACKGPTSSKPSTLVVLLAGVGCTVAAFFISLVVIARVLGGLDAIVLLTATGVAVVVLVFVVLGTLFWFGSSEGEEEEASESRSTSSDVEEARYQALDALMTPEFVNSPMKSPHGSQTLPQGVSHGESLRRVLTNDSDLSELAREAISRGGSCPPRLELGPPALPGAASWVWEYY